MNALSKTFLTLFLLLFTLAGCAQQQPADGDGDEMNVEPVSKAAADVHDREGNLLGTVTFEQNGDSVDVSAEFAGLSEGIHGFHIHRYGDCSADDFTSAGGHYNPAGANHGAPTDADRHMGDMGNLTVDADGQVTMSYTDPVIRLNGSGNILGRGIVIHAGQDDVSSQPSGAAGPRVACGVIGATAGAEM